jgi:hypothetical protein
MRSGSGPVRLSAVRWLTSLGTLAALSGGCGKVTSPNGSDAGPGSDAGGSVDANLTPVTVTVLTSTSDGAPDSTAKVVFQDPDGNVVADVMVDPQGHAQSSLPRGGSVTAIRTLTDTSTDLTAQVTTITEVAPGDALTFGLTASPGVSQGGQTTMSASFPLVSGATLYSFSTPCGTIKTPSSPVNLIFRDSCHGATFDLLGTTNAGGVPMYVRLAGVTYQAGGAFSIPTAFSAMPSFTVNASNVPAEVSSMSVTRASLAGNLSVSSLNVVVPGDPPAGNVSVTMPFPGGFGTRSELAVIMARADAQAPQEVQLHTATLGTSASVDVGKQPLPWITNVAQTATGATWTQVAPGDGTGAALLVWTGQWMASGKTVMVTRSLAQPVSTTAISMTLPRLPASYAAVDPEQQTVAVTLSGATLFMGNYDVLNGYAQIRAMPETLLTTTSGNMGALLGQPFQRRIMLAPATH